MPILESLDRNIFVLFGIKKRQVGVLANFNAALFADPESCGDISAGQLADSIV